MSRLAEVRKNAANYLTRPVVKFLSRTPVTPDTITWLGFLLTVGAAVLIVTGNLIAAGLVVLFAGFMDMLDGALARHTNRTTRFGAVLDSTLDRLAEAALLLGILVFFARQQMVAECFLAGITLLGSLMVSYVRARIEGIGLECKVGFFTRPERVIILALGLLLGSIDYTLIIALAIVTLLSFYTMVQRLFYAYRQTKDKR